MFGPSSQGRGRLLRYVAAGAAAVVMPLAVSQPASAETLTPGTPVVVGTVGSYTPATCSWHTVSQGLLAPEDAKVVSVDLPSVSGVVENQLVVAEVLFANPDPTGALMTYRKAEFYTFASPGQLTSSWTYRDPDGTYSGGWTAAQDAPGESGYASGDADNAGTYAVVQLLWADGGTFNGAVVQLAQNAGSVYHPEICNTGATPYSVP
jgi:hypothetical protein